MVLVEEFDSRAGAMRRERELKGGQGRAWIREQLNDKPDNPAVNPPQADALYR